MVIIRDMESSRPAGETVITLSELFYLLYFAVMFGARAVGIYEGLPVYSASLVAGMLLFGVKILMTEHTVFEYVWMGALMALAFLVYYSSGEKGILLCFTMMLGIKCVDRDRVLRLGAVILGIAFPVLTILTVAGILPELCHMNERSGIGFVLRHSLGYPYPNTMHTTYLILVILLTFIYSQAKSDDLRGLLILSILLFAGNVYLFLYGVSNTGFISVTLFLCLFVFFSWKKKAPLPVIAELFRRHRRGGEPIADRFLARMSQRGVADVVTQGRRGHDGPHVGNLRVAQIVVFLEEDPRRRPQGTADGTRFQTVSQPGADVIFLHQREDLRFVLKPPEGSGKNHPVEVPLKGGPLRRNGPRGTAPQPPGRQEPFPLHRTAHQAMDSATSSMISSRDFSGVQLHRARIFAVSGIRRRMSSKPLA